MFQKGTIVFEIPSSSFVATLPSVVATVGEKRTRKKTASGRTRKKDTKDGGVTASSSYWKIVE